MSAEKYVPLEKMSKRARRAYNARQRGSWNGLSPVTRVAKNGRAYDRNREKQNMRHAAHDTGRDFVFKKTMYHSA